MASWHQLRRIIALLCIVGIVLVAVLPQPWNVCGCVGSAL